MPRLRMNKPLEGDICIHLFSISAAMVGVCLNVIGIIRVVISVRQIDTLSRRFSFCRRLFLSLLMSLCLLGLADAQYSPNSLPGTNCRWVLHPGFDFDGCCLRYYWLGYYLTEFEFFRKENGPSPQSPKDPCSYDYVNRVQGSRDPNRL